MKDQKEIYISIFYEYRDKILRLCFAYLDDRSYAEDLAAVENLHVRVSIKGCSEEEFSRLTGARPEAFALQLKALDNLLEAGVSCHAAVMVSFSEGRAVDSLKRRLGEISPGLSDFEAEELFLNPAIEKRLSRIRSE